MMKKRLLALSLLSSALAFCASAQSVGRLGTAIPKSTTVPLVLPGVPTDLSPTCGIIATVSTNPTLAFVSSGATSYVITGPDTTNPPTTVHSLGGTPSYSASGLLESSVYYWIPKGVNADGSTSYPGVCSLRTVGPTTFVDHPRIFLTAAKKAQLVAKRLAGSADYLAVKSQVDATVAVNPWIADSSPLTGALTSGATSFTVTDGSTFPTSSIYVRIDLELIACSTRTGNTLSGCTRGADWPLMSRKSEAVAHSAGALVWEHDTDGFPNGSWTRTAGQAALLVQAGDTSYATIARGALSMILTHLNIYQDIAGGPGFDPGDIYFYWHQDYSRWYGPTAAMAYDWCYNDCSMTASEKSVYADFFRRMAQSHLYDNICNYNCSKIQYPIDNVPRATGAQTTAVSNAAAGEIYQAMLSSIASYPDNPDGLTYFTRAKSQLDTYQMPGLLTGPISGGPSPEGMQYAGESFTFIASELLAIETATGDTSYHSTLATWIENVATFLFQMTAPGSSSSRTVTTGSMTVGTTTLTVSSATSWNVGDGIRNNATGFESVVTAIAGTTFTLRDAATETAASQPFVHVGRFWVYGDVNQVRSSRTQDTFMAEDFFNALWVALDVLRVDDLTVARYIRYWMDNKAWPNTNHTGDDYVIRQLIHDDATVTALDYQAALPTLWGATNASATAQLIGRSAWSGTPTLVQFLVGGEMWDHVHSHFNAYQIFRKGVWLSPEIDGYGPNPSPPCCSYAPGEGIATGARAHNTLNMNGHSGANAWQTSWDQAGGVATMTRSHLNTAGGYMYGRGDASAIYGGTSWAGYGFANNAQTFVRDFLYIQAADIIAFGDRLGYSAATVSPTKWFAQFPVNPTIASQRITATYGGQTMVQDVVVPSGATLTKVDGGVESPELATYLPQAHWRVETVSGATTASEYSLQVIQLGDSGFSPGSVTSLTTTNANVAQVGSGYVIGCVKGATPTLSISYVVTGTPRNLVMGMAASTAYHVTRSVNTITIAAATGSGDTASTAAGVLDFTL